MLVQSRDTVEVIQVEVVDIVLPQIQMEGTELCFEFATNFNQNKPFQYRYWTDETQQRQRIQKEENQIDHLNNKYNTYNSINSSDPQYCDTTVQWRESNHKHNKRIANWTNGYLLFDCIDLISDRVPICSCNPIRERRRSSPTSGYGKHGQFGREHWRASRNYR